jgi:Protein of unknown function (DUF2723)
VDTGEARFTRTLLPAIVALSAVGYTATAPHWILGGDNGEFATMYAVGGIAHPPGYPSMVLWLRLWHWLPVDSPAYGAALATVMLGVTAVFLVQRACLAWGASTAATALASAIYAFSPMAWKMSCHAEVFAMNAMFAGAILTLSAPSVEWVGARGVWKLGLFGLLGGFALADQQSIVLLAPVGLLAGVRAARATNKTVVAAVIGLAALLVGLLIPYVYVYVVATTSDPRTTPMWIEARSLAGVFFHLRRGAYGTLSLAGLAVEANPLGNLGLFARNGTRQTLGLPFVVLLAAVLAVVRGRHKAIERPILASLVALAATFLLAGPLFIARFNLPFVGASPTVAERFYLLPEVVLTVMGALAFDSLLPWLMARDGLVAAISLQAALAASILTVPEVLEHNRPTVDLYIRNTLAAAPKNARVVGSGDHRWGGFMYARYALHLRTDVVFLVPGIMTQAWYRHELQDLTGVPLEGPGHRPLAPKELLARMLAASHARPDGGEGSPVFYTDWLDEPSLQNTPHDTVGTLMQVLEEGETGPTVDELEAMNLSVFEKYELEPTPPEDPHGWGYTLQADYARPWGELGEAYRREGRMDKAQECLARAASLAPWTIGVR